MSGFNVRVELHQLKLFEIKFTYEVENILRDDFGWVEGHEPGCDRWYPKEGTKVIAASHETFAKAWVEKYYNTNSVRNLVIVSVEEKNIQIDGAVDVSY